MWDIDIFKKNEVYPLIDELVEVLYNDRLHNLVDTKCETDEDKRIFMMFLLMYYYTYMNVPKEVKNNEIKEQIKIFLSEIIRDPNKRLKCIELYNSFEETIKLRLK